MPSIQGRCALSLSPVGNRIAFGTDGSENQMPSVKFLDFNTKAPGSASSRFSTWPGALRTNPSGF